MTERLLTWAQLAELVPYCRDHIRRLELSGDFPKRLQLGKGRIAWRASDVAAWIASRERGPLPIRISRGPRDSQSA
jgi:predicted DNA-binding transcriptional regulator AlpA